MKKLFLTMVLILVVCSFCLFPMTVAAEIECNEEEPLSSNSAVRYINMKNNMSYYNLTNDVKAIKILNDLDVDERTQNNLTLCELEKIAEADSIQLTSMIWGDAAIDESNKTYDDGVIVYNVLLDYGETKQINGKTYKKYETQVWVSWNSMPAYRLVDVLAITASNNSVYGSQQERFGNAILYFTDPNGTDSEEYELYSNTSNNILSEYSNYNFAMKIDLPYNNSAIEKYYTSMFFMLGTTIYNEGLFNVYSAYGHKYIAATAQISTNPGVAIGFKGLTTNYSGIMLSNSAAQ